MKNRPSYPVSRLDYNLPTEQIAQYPLPERTDSRLLHIHTELPPSDRTFAELPGLLPDNCLIVFNNSRVIPARIYGRRKSGGRVEVLFHRWIGDGIAEAVVGSSAKLPQGEFILLPGGWSCILQEPKALDGIRVQYLDERRKPAEPGSLLDYFEKHGITPLPPYIRRNHLDQQDITDTSRYQTVYASYAGSVAAPTAGLHFNEEMLKTLAAAGHDLLYVTLHVGLGTFAPVRVDDLAEHEMHSELFSVTAEAADSYFTAIDQGQTVVAVGTTSLRVLHTLLEQGPNQQFTGETDAFIYPGRETEAADLLLTNFHLPRSTLLALVYAFGNQQRMRSAYEHAVESKYRFYSYGDCMLVDRLNTDAATMGI